MEDDWDFALVDELVRNAEQENARKRIAQNHQPGAHLQSSVQFQDLHPPYHTGTGNGQIPASHSGLHNHGTLLQQVPANYSAQVQSPKQLQAKEQQEAGISLPGQAVAVVQKKLFAADTNGATHCNRQEGPASAEGDTRQLKSQLAEKDGAVSLLRSRVAQAEQELLELRRRLSNPERVQHVDGNQDVGYRQEISRLMDQLQFKDQEINEARQSKADREDRLKKANAKAAQLEAQLETLKQDGGNAVGLPAGAENHLQGKPWQGEGPQRLAAPQRLQGTSQHGLARPKYFESPPKARRLQPDLRSAQTVSHAEPYAAPADRWTAPWSLEDSSQVGRTSGQVALPPRQEGAHGSPAKGRDASAHQLKQKLTSIRDGHSSQHHQPLLVEGVATRPAAVRAAAAPAGQSTGASKHLQLMANGSEPQATSSSRTAATATSGEIKDVGSMIRRIWQPGGAKDHGAQVAGKLFAACRAELYAVLKTSEGEGNKRDGLVDALGRSSTQRQAHEGVRPQQLLEKRAGKVPSQKKRKGEEAPSAPSAPKEFHFALADVSGQR